jgi:hypothetical protein
MKTVRMIVSVPQSLKAKLDSLRAQGTSISGIRHLLQQHFNQPQAGRKAGK